MKFSVHREANFQYAVTNQMKPFYDILGETETEQASTGIRKSNELIGWQ